MQEKKFYQNYVIESKEEVLALMALLFKDGISTYMDEMSGNFVQEDVADKDIVDFSCSYLITEDIDNIIDGWIDKYKTVKELFVVEKVDDAFIKEVIKNLYTKMIGDKDFEELLRKDKKTFGSSVNFYEHDSFVNMFRVFSQEGV